MHPFERRYGPKPTPDETVTTHASDGWRLALHHYRPRGKNPSGEPVLLQHGLGSCSKQFDLGVGTEEFPAPSIAHWLADQGYDVWACDLRGSGGSQRPGENEPLRWDWSVDDFIQKDGPAFVEFILARTGFDSLHWVGHSMGGILLLCYTALHGSPRIASGVSAAAGLDYSGSRSSYDAIEPLKELGRLVKRVPAGLGGKLLSPLFGRIPNPMEASFFHAKNIAPAAARAIPAGANYDLSGEALYQLATLFHEGGLQSMDGKTRFADLAPRIETPILFMSGEKDLQCSPAVVDKAHAMADGKQHGRAAFGKSTGQKEHYGHFDLFAGMRADREVFPHVLQWLQAHPARQKRIKAVRRSPHLTNGPRPAIV
jgi:pimeloyl-ACP methyl ester carboxylesterase